MKSLLALSAALLMLSGCNGGDPAPEVGKNAAGTEGIPAQDTPAMAARAESKNARSQNRRPGQMSKN